MTKTDTAPSGPLDTLTKAGKKWADKRLRRDEEVPLTFIYQTGAGVRGVLFVPDTELLDTQAARRAVAVRFGGLMRAQGAAHYCVVHEAWMAVRSAAEADSVAPSEDPNRQDVLIVCAFGRRGEQSGSVWRIDSSRKSRRLVDAPDLNNPDANGWDFKTWHGLMDDPAFAHEGAGNA